MEGFDPKICLFKIEAGIKIQDAILKMGVIGAKHSEVETILEKSGIEIPKDAFAINTSTSSWVRKFTKSWL